MGYKQDSVLKLLLTDNEFISDMRDYIEPRFFESELLENIVKFAFSYFDDYGCSPKKQIFMQLEKFLKKQDFDIAKDYESYLKRIFEVEVDRTKYIEDYVVEFAKEARVKALFIDGFELVDRGKVSQAVELINNFNKTLPDKDIDDLCYTSATSRTYLSKIEGSDSLFKTGIKALDRILQYPFNRRDLVCIAGPNKSGKSWFMMELGLRAGLHGLKVVHISHENDVGDIECRYDQLITRTIRSPEGRNITYIERNEFGEVVNNNRTIYRESVYNCPTALSARRVITKCGGDIRIKKFPMRSASFSDIIRYLDSLENRYNFVPDVVIQDYPDIMYLPGREELRHQLNTIYMQHKQLADERNLLCLVASQTSKATFDQKFVTKKGISEDYRKLAHCDLAFGINKDPEQGKFGVANIYVMARRNGRDEMGCSIQQELESGFFSTSSWLDMETSAVCYEDRADFA